MTNGSMVMAMVLAIGLGLFSACGKSNLNQEVKILPKTALGQKIDQCAKAQLPKDYTTLKAKTEASVCRADDQGSAVVAKMTPRFQVAAREGRIAIRQVVVVEEQDLKPNSEREQALTELLNNVCQPRMRALFARSGLRAEAAFRAYRPNVDRMNSGLPRGGEARKRSTTDSTGSDLEPFHLLLKTVPTADGGVALADELDAAKSGPLKSETPAAAHLEFCAQVTRRLGENFGLVTGRDCASRADQTMTFETAKADAARTAKPSTVSPALGSPSLMKPQKAIDLFEKGRIDKSELTEIVDPVCGGSGLSVMLVDPEFSPVKAADSDKSDKPDKSEAKVGTIEKD